VLAAARGDTPAAPLERETLKEEPLAAECTMVFGSWRLCSWAFSASKTVRASAATSSSMSVYPSPRHVRPIAANMVSLSSSAYSCIRGDGRAEDGGLGADLRGRAGGRDGRVREWKNVLLPRPRPSPHDVVHTVAFTRTVQLYHASNALPPFRLRSLAYFGRRHPLALRELRARLDLYRSRITDDRGVVVREGHLSKLEASFTCITAEITIELTRYRYHAVLFAPTVLSYHARKVPTTSFLIRAHPLPPTPRDSPMPASTRPYTRLSLHPSLITDARGAVQAVMARVPDARTYVTGSAGRLQKHALDEPVELKPRLEVPFALTLD
jgi:hypothetical protein